VAQARAALRDHKDVMTAAERIFDGKYDKIEEQGPADTSSTGDQVSLGSIRPMHSGEC
jgi:hypothetical protein